MSENTGMHEYRVQFQMMPFCNSSPRVLFVHARGRGQALATAVVAIERGGEAASIGESDMNASRLDFTPEEKASFENCNIAYRNAGQGVLVTSIEVFAPHNLGTVIKADDSEA